MPPPFAAAAAATPPPPMCNRICMHTCVYSCLDAITNACRRTLAHVYYVDALYTHTFLSFYGHTESPFGLERVWVAWVEQAKTVVLLHHAPRCV